MTGHNLYVVNAVVCSVCVFYTMIVSIAPFFFARIESNDIMEMYDVIGC